MAICFASPWAVGKLVENTDGITTHDNIQVLYQTKDKFLFVRMEYSLPRRGYETTYSDTIVPVIYRGGKKFYASKYKTDYDVVWKDFTIEQQMRIGFAP